MTRFEVDSVEVEAAAARARTSAGTIHAEVAGMMTQLLDLQSTWSGAAAESFAGVAQEWRATQQVVEQSLAQITEALDLAARTYADAETSAHGLFAR
ncbi:WXG100 family type VII secretion target [Georgenia satyanarayanai]|uniref:ESAT-6-like protein n=1 Tax=Georgenia satyanarayanai TaxID=860221 RepID=A0A2Y9BWL4_9MICO|nr:WXG100 family type VII secretion target [Georgenia satyanarayanai]PYG01033.1 WXG100 family type VII secretion target [Georgenia satyanarayanai]SSA39272.1 WXG100 family type VII secretion target [Georgenia satyanarayanai]